MIRGLQVRELFWGFHRPVFFGKLNQGMESGKGDGEGKVQTMGMNRWTNNGFCGFFLNSLVSLSAQFASDEEMRFR